MRFHRLEEDLREQGQDAEWIANSQKFYAGDAWRLPSRVVLTAASFPRLPYANLMVEFRHKVSDGRVVGVIASLNETPFPGVVDVALFLQNLRHPHTWHPYGCEARIHRRQGNEAFEFLVPGKLILRSEINLAQRSGDVYAVSLSYLESFFRILNCTNVSAEETNPPQRLNTKRAQSGKPPLYSYNTLVLRARHQSQMVIGDGSHDAPRIHLRRGHIKHRKTGEFWWQPCVVGDRSRGVVMKDYDASKMVSP